MARPGQLPWRVRRRALASGRETPLFEIAPSQVSGVRLSQVYLSPDGRSWVHSYSRLLTDLYLAQGLQ